MNLGDVVLMPGLVNAHCHLELTAMRGFLEDLDFRRWIVRLTGARRAILDRDALLDSARYGLVEGVQAGITPYARTPAEVGRGRTSRCARPVCAASRIWRSLAPDPVQCDASMAGLREKVSGLRYLETPLVRIGMLTARANTTALSA